jgi:hypothetical protein
MDSRLKEGRKGVYESTRTIVPNDCGVVVC